MIHVLSSYLPQDRLQSLARGGNLPDHALGTALFADISGFTPLTETLTQQLGPRRGIEELMRQINAVYDGLISEIEKRDGSVISFAGDAITCWFEGKTGENSVRQSAARAVSSAVAMQTAMQTFPKLSLKIALTSGTVRRFAVGNPAIQLLDALAGKTIASLDSAGHLAKSNEIVLDTATSDALENPPAIKEWRVAENGKRFAVLEASFGFAPNEFEITAQPIDDTPQISAELLRPWVLPAVFEREQSGHGAFITELRPTVALFLRFTGIDYDEDAQAQEKLSRLISEVQTIVTSYEGTLLDLNIGDKGSYLYISFGALVAHENDARRAVQAALELQQRLRLLNFLQPISIGISKGTMRVGAYGGTTRRAYGALSDETNIAARLMTIAVPGEILISSAVQKATSADFLFETRPLVQVKGKADPLSVFSVLGARQRRAIRLEEPAYALPMMGRQAELALIDEKLELAAKGRGQIIGITGEAGMGKSRLIAEVIRFASQRGFTGYGGACESSGMNTPYLVWKTIWQAFFNVDPSLSVEKQIQELEDEVKKLAPSRVPAIPVLSILLDTPIEENDFTRALEPKDRRNVLIAFLEDCLKAAAINTPILFVLEDLHWIDALSHELLETLALVSASRPVCFLVAYRPPETARLQAPRIEILPNFTHVALDRLNAGEAEQLIQAKLEQLFPLQPSALPNSLTTQLTNRAEGNPFYIEELLNYLYDRDINPYEEQALKSLELPTSLHALILSRIDRLSESEKITIKTASIIGRLFRVAWLHGYYPALGTIDRIKADLAELEQLDLTPLDTPEPELAYLFKHIVTHEVAYESLPHTTRSNLHERLAEFIETQGAERYLDLLAFHYSLTENKPKQREFLQKAGESAQAAFANEAALDYFNRLLPLLENDPQATLNVHLQRGTVLDLIGQWTEAETAYRNALFLAETIEKDFPTESAQAKARGQYLLGMLFRARLDYPSALTFLSQAGEAFKTQNDLVNLALTHIEKSIVWWRQGEYENARRELEIGLELAETLTNKSVMAQTLLNLGLIARSQGDSKTARALAEESLILFRELRDKPNTVTALMDLSGVESDEGNRTEAKIQLEESLALCREMGDKRGITMALNNLGNITIEQQDFQSAATYYKESLALCHEGGFKIGIVFNLSGLAAVVAHRDEFQRAAQLAAAAEKLLLTTGSAWEVAEGRIYRDAVATAQAGLTTDKFAEAWAKGQEMSQGEAIADALKI